MNLTYVVYRDDLDYLPVLASLPPQQTVFEYLVGCWKRLNSSRLALTKKVNLDHLHHLAENMKRLQLVRTGISTDGNAASIRQARDFAASHYQLYWLDTTGTRDVPSTRRASSRSSQSISSMLTSSLLWLSIHRRAIGAPELVGPLLSLSSLSAPLSAPSTSSTVTLAPIHIEPFLQDLAKRFEPDDEIDGVLGPVVTHLCFHESLFRPEGLAGGDAGWRGVIAGLEALVGVKSVACMMTRLEAWNPANASAATIERVSLLGPLLRLGVFEREWVSGRLGGRVLLGRFRTDSFLIFFLAKAFDCEYLFLKGKG